MAHQRVKLIYPPGLVTQPVLAHLALDHRVMADIRRANVEDGTGWLVCELEGDAIDLTSGLAWLVEIGVEVESLGDVVES
ncbi:MULTISPECIES: NIL domain-containing protein [Acidithrix]|uniref:NIL domain protein n=1 Tax=Acidithrix ferrooxidans TaxID=1280514 RepID=A0A0D8HJ91_9ACTN|nr:MULTISPECIES: NIL domain-containing protein [Acidithrix]KJF17993.1 NIL domain protein [Acidithrix ferrooxidans]